MLKVDNIVTTDSDFEGQGHETLVINNNELDMSNFTLKNPDTGQKMHVKAHFTFDVGTGAVVVNRFRLKCVRE